MANKEDDQDRAAEMDCIDQSFNVTEFETVDIIVDRDLLNRIGKDIWAIFQREGLTAAAAIGILRFLEEKVSNDYKVYLVDWSNDLSDN